MHFGNRDYERADALFEAEREAGIRAVVARLDLPGKTHCRDCGEPIEPARLAALPSARRCADCQEQHELKVRLNGR